MPNYTCNVCLLPKNGDCKRLKRNTPYWDFHEHNRSSTLPRLQEGRICPRCYQKVYNFINPRGKADQARVPAPQPAPAIGQAQATVPTVQPSPAPALPHAPGSAEVPGPAFLAPAPGPSRQPSTAPTLSQAPGCSRTPASGLAQTLRQQSALASGTTHLAQVTAQESGQQPVSEPSRVLQPTQVSVIEPHRTTPALGPGEILVRAVGRTNRICSVCGQEARQLSMQEVSGMLSACTWVAAETFLPMKNRICNVHVENGRLSQAALESLSKRSQMKVMTESKLLKHLKHLIISAVQYVPEEPKNPLDFDSPLLTESAYETYTGLSKKDFEDLIPYLSGSIHDSVNRSKRNALAVFLCKLRMNNSQKALGELFGMDQQRISEVFHNVADALHKKFMPLNLGYQHISRDDFIKDHSRTLASVFFDQQPNSCMLVLDGTYLEIEKSSNFQLPHDSYSGHKHYNLVKPMLVTGTDGYIIGAEGLYLGNNNDASILSSMMTPGSAFENFVEEEDILILDRGFRDNKSELDEAGIRMVMPNLLTGGRKQFQDAEANESRLVTMIRWVIEAVNGRLKNKFKFFRDRISNSYMANGFLMKLVEISCAILNKYFPIVAPDKEGDLERAQLIKSKVGISNLLMELITERGWLTSRVNYLSMDLEHLEDFPRLTMQCLRDISLGIYQIRMARSYSAQHVQEGDYQFSVHREMLDLIRVKMKSRFRGDTVHTLWIHYRPNGIGPGSIRGFYCRCQSGARTLGCCSHIMSVLWYFGIGRHNPHLKFPAGNIGANLLDSRTQRE